MAKKTTAPSTAMVKWDEEFAGLAKEATKGMELPTGKFLSFKSGQMSFGGAAIEGNELHCVVVGMTHQNTYYDEEYDPKNTVSPACYAFGPEKDEMQPHDEAEDKQHSDCASCPHNQFGSALKGEGKACKNLIRLAMIAEGDLEDISAAEVVYASIPVMSTKNWNMYATKKVRDTLKRPYWAVVTVMKLVPDGGSQFRVNFEFAELVEDSKLFTPLKKLWESTMEGIDFPFAKNGDREKSKKAPAKAQKFSSKGRK